MWLEVERGCLASTEEVRDVLHLYKWHPGWLVFDARRGDCQVDEPIACC